MSKEQVNNGIKARTVLLIDQNGINIGAILTYKAITMAKDAGLDLVAVSGGDQPTCKILDYGKWKYEQSKKEKKSRASQIQQQTKEIKLRPTTGDNDLKYRADHVEEFLKNGHKVKIIVKCKGREKQHMSETASSILSKFMALIKIDYKVEQQPISDSSSIFIILTK